MVSVGAAALQSVADVVIYVSMVMYISLGRVFAGGVPGGGGWQPDARGREHPTAEPARNGRAAGPSSWQRWSRAAVCVRSPT